jgi:hypothetical protein
VEVLTQLVADGQDTLAQQWATLLGKDYQVRARAEGRGGRSTHSVGWWVVWVGSAVLRTVKASLTALPAGSRGGTTIHSMLQSRLLSNCLTNASVRLLRFIALHARCILMQHSWSLLECPQQCWVHQWVTSTLAVVAVACADCRYLLWRRVWH